MEQRDWLAALYILGTLVTAGGVILAYFQARKQKHFFDKLHELNDFDDELDLALEFVQGLAGEHDKIAQRAAEREALRAPRQAAVDEALLALGIEDGPVNPKDLRLPMAYWSKRSAYADTIESFRVGGLISLAGLVISLVASVWSLYL